MADSRVSAYKPPSYLVARLFLTADQIIPEFEVESFKTQIELEKLQLVAALQKSEDTTKTLESAIDNPPKAIKVLQTPNTTKPRELLGIVGQLPPSTITSENPVHPTIIKTSQPHKVRNVGTESTVKVTFEAKPWGVDMTAETTEASKIVSHWSHMVGHSIHWLRAKVRAWDWNTTLETSSHFRTSICRATHSGSVWLTGFNMSLDNPWRLKTFIADATENGFTLFSAGVAWVSYPAGDSAIHSTRAFRLALEKPSKLYASLLDAYKLH